ncbi:TetR/AcrR family transcriptional regulator [Nocardia sp. alder85J]|uniref:TetR/AcrR family transcriptional regulator n=1 Tax=Nocardia sp. alder85J TaxID=2862949 RepID=UPI001CD58857|nr:TetR family transcriptional regulator [Nocardia sp. alder85J]MCX4096040.1 TetR family transcriptional regulator [Nocardia sp. alder85J]
MFKGAAVPERSADELNTRARIRDAAISVFGEEGFGVGVRAIATAAGVSPGLVNHHFGSKDGLRGACDDHVREVIRRAKLDYMEHPSPTGLLQSLAEIEEYAPYIAYLRRAFAAGGALMLDLYEHMAADVTDYLRAGIASGVLRPLRDVDATARYMAYQNGGGFFLFLQVFEERQGGPLDYRTALRDYAEQMLLPALEIYTNGLLTDSMMLDTMLGEQVAGGSAAELRGEQ